LVADATAKSTWNKNAVTNAAVNASLLI